MLNLLIVEDEPPIARRIEKIARTALRDQLGTLHVAQTLAEAETHLAQAAVDVLLLDLNLHGRDGFELLARAVAGSFHTIVVSANTDQALRAFEYGTLDFVPKPVAPERLARALARVTEAQNRSEFAATTLAVHKHGRIEPVSLDAVRYIKGAGPYSELILAGGRAELHNKSLDKLLAILPPSFERVHKSYLVDLRRVKAWHTGEGSRYELELSTGEFVPVGRERWKELKARMK
jgi:DNA-binding LytR/AlgR family response regulator